MSFKVPVGGPKKRKLLRTKTCPFSSNSAEHSKGTPERGRRSSRVRTPVLNFWDFEQVERNESMNGTLELIRKKKSLAGKLLVLDKVCIDSLPSVNTMGEGFSYDASVSSPKKTAPTSLNRSLISSELTEDQESSGGSDLGGFKTSTQIASFSDRPLPSTASPDLEKGCTVIKTADQNTASTSSRVSSIPTEKSTSRSDGTRVVENASANSVSDESSSTSEPELASSILQDEECALDELEFEKLTTTTGADAFWAQCFMNEELTCNMLVLAQGDISFTAPTEMIIRHKAGRGEATTWDVNDDDRQVIIEMAQDAKVLLPRGFTMTLSPGEESLSILLIYRTDPTKSLAFQSN